MPGLMSQSIGVRLIALVVLVLANAFFVAAEFALVAARRTRIDALVRRGDRKAKTVQTALQDLYRQLSAAQLGITVASILLGYVAEDTVAHLFRDWFATLPPVLNFLTRGGVASVVAVTLISFLHVVFGEQARKVMTPRTDIVALPIDLSLEEAADQVAVAGRSRYPVYRETLDDVVGLVHAKDILAGLRSAKGDSLRAVLRPAVFVPGTREVEDVLADMKRQKIHLAIVLDEFGGTAGLVTMEDLLEEIVGQIYDEYDRPSGETYTVPGEGAPVLSGAMPLRDVNQIYGLGLDEGSYTTIGGYLFGTLGRLPKVGDRVTVLGAAFEIVEMEGRRVGAARLLQQVAGEGTTP